MENVNFVLKKLGAKNGLAMALDENGACTLELSDGRVMLIQERADLDALDFVATLGPVPEEVRRILDRNAAAINAATPLVVENPAGANAKA